jgi:hypothetical protein
MRRSSRVERLTAAVVAVLALVAVAGPAAAGGTGTLQGRVVAGGAGLDGVAIEVYLEQKTTAGGAPFAATESRAGGAFSLELPAGKYYLWAKGKPPAFGPPLVAAYPANPVVVSAGAANVLAVLELREVGRGAAAPAPPGTGLAGRVLEGGRPAAEVSVMVYGAGAAQLTGPGFLASQVTGPDGRFSFDLAAGSYRVSARKRQGGAAAGFLRAGDLSAEYAGNPAFVRAGEYVALGDLALHPVDARRLAERERSAREGSAPTRLGGTVTGPGNRPLAGQYVFVYRDAGMIGRPALVAVSGADGAFALDLPHGGTWYVGARSSRGGPRQQGEMAGRLAGSPDSSVAVPEGTTVRGLVVLMEAGW